MVPIKRKKAEVPLKAVIIIIIIIIVLFALIQIVTNILNKGLL